MGNVIIHATISLDGFIAGENDDFSWMFKYGPTDNKIIDEIFSSTGAIVAGNRSVDVEKDQIPYGGKIKAPVIIVTHTPRETVIKNGIEYIFNTNGVAGAIEAVKALAKRKNINVIGASIAQQCLALKLADEIQLHVVPVLLGKGLHIFENITNGPIELERVNASTATQITDLRFRVIK